MTVLVTTVLKPKPGRLAEAVRFCQENVELAEEGGGNSRLYTAIAAGPGTGDLINVTEWENAEAFGRAMDAGPPKQVIEQIKAGGAGDDTPVELVSVNLSVEVPKDASSR